MEELIPTAIRLGTILGVAILLTVVTRWFLSTIHDRFIGKSNKIASAIFDILPRPVIWTIWLIASAWILEEFSDYCRVPGVSNPVYTLQKVGLILIVTWTLYQWKTRSEKIYLQKRFERKKDRMDKAAMNAMARLTSILLFVGSGLMILDAIGVPPATLVAFGGAGAVAGGLAGQDIVKNFFGGLMIHVTRPFTEGDWINSPDKSIEGTVEQIGWYQTLIRSFEKRPIYVPNALFISMVIQNPSRMTHRRILQTIGVRYDDFKVVKSIIDETERMLNTHPDIATDAITMVHFMEYGPHSLDFNIYTFTKTTDWATWRSVQQEVLLKVGEIIERHGAEIAYPTRTLHIENSK